jgi:hypothetical protein
MATFVIVQESNDRLTTGAKDLLDKVMFHLGDMGGWQLRPKSYIPERKGIGGQQNWWRGARGMKLGLDLPHDYCVDVAWQLHFAKIPGAAQYCLDTKTSDEYKSL